MVLQEDSEKAGKVTAAGMYFLHYQVYRLDPTVNAVCDSVDIKLLQAVFTIVQKIGLGPKDYIYDSWQWLRILMLRFSKS